MIALVIDDLPSIRWIIARRLRELGFRNIIEASDSEKAIEQLSLEVEKGLPVSLIVSDLSMPNTDGIELLKLIRSFPEFQNIPCVLIGNTDEPEIPQRIKALGEITVAAKPIEPEAFNEKVREALAKSINKEFDS